MTGRVAGKVSFEGPTVDTWQEAEQYVAQYGAIEEFGKLTLERTEKGVVEEGSCEWSIVTDL